MGEGREEHPEHVHPPHRELLPPPPLGLEVSKPLSLLYHVPTFPASDYATTPQRLLGRKKKREGCALHTRPPSLPGGPAPALTAPLRSGDGQGCRKAAPPGSVAGGARGAAGQTPRPGRAASPPPPAQLRAGRRRPQG